MIPAYLYSTLYLLFVTILTFVLRSRYISADINREERYYIDESFAIFLVVALSLFIGFRPADGVYFGDTSGYYLNYKIHDGDLFRFDTSVIDPVFNNLFNWWASNSLGCDTFFVLIAFIYFGCTYLGIKRIFPDDRLAAFVTFLGAFSTFSYGTNGIRSGVAAAIFILAISYREKLAICISLMLISLGIHHSMQLPIGAFIITLLFKNPKAYFYGWMLCLIIAFLHIQTFANLFAGYTDESGAGYLAGANGIRSDEAGGFRIDFILYSAMPVIVGYYTIFKREIEVSDTYSQLLRLYLCTNGIWMLCMYANYTNRIAYLSWFLYPIVLIYPFLCENWGENKYRLFSRTMIYHLCFTLFMSLIYYHYIVPIHK